MVRAYERRPAAGAQAVGKKGLAGWRLPYPQLQGAANVPSHPSPLETVETTFRLLATGPQPLALNGHTIGLRRDSIGLWDLRGLLFHPATDGVQRAALVELVGGRADIAVPG